MTTRAFDGIHKQGIDADIERQLAEHCQKYKIDPLTAVQMFPVLVRRQWMKRFLAHTELFKMTLDVPGDIAEVGVFRGLGLMTWANLLECYCIGDRTKIVYGFDNWKGFTELAPEDGRVESTVQKEVGGFSPEPYFEELQHAIHIYDQDRFVSWKDRIKLVVGDIVQTPGTFVKDNPGVRFSLIHMDCDLYKPTKAAVEAFWPRLSRGGVIIFDEYAIKQWPGETQAVDELLAGLPGVKVKTFSWTNAPAGYIVKE